VCTEPPTDEYRINSSGQRAVVFLFLIAGFFFYLQADLCKGRLEGHMVEPGACLHHSQTHWRNGLFQPLDAIIKIITELESGDLFVRLAFLFLVPRTFVCRICITESK
jgi:hypothetical protein